ncbi:hypothetical protein [Methylobacterium segetis]|uniref:hypothetical protein n=1 Tax=Methylobacterium segetis TaxID=2488750 RepID=UPI00104CD1BA|nr:hypothetical protein [Methylobacterium segetis]
MRPRSGPSAGAGAVLGGLVAIAVLAAFSLPLVFSRGSAARAPLPSAVAAVSIAEEPIRPEPASLSPNIEPAPLAAPPPAERGERAAPSLELPVLQEAAAEIDLEPPSVTPPPPAPRASPRTPLPPKRPPGNVARAAP